MNAVVAEQPENIETPIGTLQHWKTRKQQKHSSFAQLQDLKNIYKHTHMQEQGLPNQQNNQTIFYTLLCPWVKSIQLIVTYSNNDHILQQGRNMWSNQLIPTDLVQYKTSSNRHLN